MRALLEKLALCKFRPKTFLACEKCAPNNKGLYTSHVYSSFCIELRSIPAGKPHVVYLAGVQAASIGTLNI